MVTGIMLKCGKSRQVQKSTNTLLVIKNPGIRTDFLSLLLQSQRVKMSAFGYVTSLINKVFKVLKCFLRDIFTKPALLLLYCQRTKLLFCSHLIGFISPLVSQCRLGPNYDDRKNKLFSPPILFSLYVTCSQTHRSMTGG